MALRKYPGRTEPFVSQRSPQGRRGQGFGIGAILFIFVMLAIFIIALYLIPTLMEDAVFPDIGIPYSNLFIILIGVSIFAIIYGFVKGGLLQGQYTVRYRERDPSICRRVIRDGPDGAEFIVAGHKEDTFEQACIANWQFESTDLKSKWYIKDEKGNDVTDKPLESADGVFLLIPEYGSEIQKEETDESDEYSSIHDGVTYYD